MPLLNIPGYDQATAYTGEYEPLPPGGYICRIKNTKIEPWANGNGQSLVLALDICEGEKAGFYQRQFDADTSQNKKWRGTHRQTIPKGDKTESDTKSLGWFKGMITSIESSNDGFKWNKDTDTLKGKIVGCIFGREEYLNPSDGKPRWATKVMQIRSADTIRKGDYNVPNDKKLENIPSLEPPTPGLTNITNFVDEDDLPF